MPKGFTLIELLLVIGLILTLSVATAPVAGSFLQRVIADTSRDNLVSALHRAQANSLDGRGNGDWGICYFGQTIRVYTGTCLSPTLAEDTLLLPTVALTGFSTTTFARPTGLPSQALSLSLTVGATTRQITVNSLGVVDYD